MHCSYSSVPVSWNLVVQIAPRHRYPVISARPNSCALWDRAASLCRGIGSLCPNEYDFTVFNCASQLPSTYLWTALDERIYIMVICEEFGTLRCPGSLTIRES